MRCMKSSKKPPRQSIENPSLVVRMKPSSSRKTKADSNIFKAKTDAGKPSRRLAKISETVSVSKSETSTLSVSWVASLRDFKANNQKAVGPRRSPRNNGLETSSCEAKKADATLPNSSCKIKSKAAEDRTEDPESSKAPPASNTPFASFRFKAASKSSTTPSLRITAPTPVAFGSSFTPNPNSSFRDLANNNINNTPSICSKTKEALRKQNSSFNCNLQDGKSSPRNLTRQRGVLLPLLKEKDAIIAKLEETLANIETKCEDCKNEEVTKENVMMKEKLKILEDRVKELTKEAMDNEDKILELEDKNMRLLKSLEIEQMQVSHLQAELDQMSTNRDMEEVDYQILIEHFVEKLSVLCRDKNLKTSVSSDNVRLKISTRAISSQPGSREQSYLSNSTSLESTHLCEQQLVNDCYNFHQFAELREIEEEATEDNIVDEDLKFREVSVQSPRKKQRAESKAKKATKRQDLNSSMGLKLKNLSLDESESKSTMEVNEKQESDNKSSKNSTSNKSKTFEEKGSSLRTTMPRQTRSMSRKASINNK